MASSRNSSSNRKNGLASVRLVRRAKAAAKASAQASAANKIGLRRLNQSTATALVEHIDYVKADGKEDAKLTAEFIDTHSF